MGSCICTFFSEFLVEINIKIFLALLIPFTLGILYKRFLKPDIQYTKFEIFKVCLVEPLSHLINSSYICIGIIGSWSRK